MRVRSSSAFLTGQAGGWCALKEEIITFCASVKHSMMALKSCLDTCRPIEISKQGHQRGRGSGWRMQATTCRSETYLVPDCACGQEAVFLEEHCGATGKREAMLLVLSIPLWFSFSSPSFFPLSITIAIFFLFFNQHPFPGQLERRWIRCLRRSGGVGWGG